MDSLRFLNLSGNELKGLPNQAMRLKIEKVRLKNNFMKKAFWKDFNHHKVASLSDLSLSKLSTRFRELSPEVRSQLSNTLICCDVCQTNFVGQVYVLLRPCEEIWGRKNIPFLFNCCSWSCYQKCKVSEDVSELQNIHSR